jgi:hypothetical protein
MVALAALAVTAWSEARASATQQVWSAAASLPAADAAAAEQFGSAVAISGDTAVVGASQKTIAGNVGQGGLYVFARAGATWMQQGPVLVPDDGTGGDAFGSSVAIFGDTAVIGAPNKTVGTFALKGAAYVFARIGTSWAQQGPGLSVREAFFSGSFGSAVGISQNTIVVGAPYGGNVLRGAAYIFEGSGASWLPQGTLVAGDGASADQFGASVSISGDTIVVGAPQGGTQGAAYVFVRNGAGWEQQGPALSSTEGFSSDEFGTSVAISGNTIVVGSPYGGPAAQGAADVFVRSGTGWLHQGPRLVAADGQTIDAFGTAVSISGDTIVVGAARKVIAGAPRAAAYVFVRDGTTWTQQGPKLPAATGAAGDITGASVSVDGDTLLVGGPGEDAGQGATLVFSRGPCTRDSGCCAHDSECPTGSYCAAMGVCQPQLALGSSCVGVGTDPCMEVGCNLCATRSCSDGVCCDSACNGACEACTGILTGGSDGACLPIPADQDPEGECEADRSYPQSCKADGNCDGNRACRAYAKSGTACGAAGLPGAPTARCVDNAVTDTTCDGAGRCRQQSVACAPYLCVTAACRTSCRDDTECDAATAFCNEGVCTSKQMPAAPCQRARQCVTGFCVDGVCCESECGQQCEACGEVGKAGICIPVSGVPRGNRAFCTGNSAACSGRCDGVDTNECQYPTSTTGCAQACNGAELSQSSCDGRGNCGTPQVSSCAPYACGPQTCLKSCLQEADCADGYHCVRGACIAPAISDAPGAAGASDVSATDCTTDLSGVVDALSGQVSNCAPYRCSLTTRTCSSACRTGQDCADGLACTSEGTCNRPLSAKESSSNGCATGARAPGQGAVTSLGLLLSFALFSRFRRRPRTCPRSTERMERRLPCG